MITKFCKKRSGGSSSRSSQKRPLSPSIDRIIHGDALETLKTLPSDSIDLVVTDPPYGYFFLNRDWDRAVPPPDVWRECLRVLKPGAVMFVMSSPRQDCLWQMLGNLREAGFRVNFTSIYWAYSSGLPKAMNISKAVDKRLGARRPKVVGFKRTHGLFKGFDPGGRYDRRAVTPEAAALDGSYGGFQPKPAVEVILVAMKPLSERTFTEQALANRKGITWLDQARMPYRPGGPKCRRPIVDVRGRFPANLIVSDQSLKPEKFADCFSLDAWWEEKIAGLPASVRESFPFLVVPKASQAERYEGLEAVSNFHPTVKPLKLMWFLVTLASQAGDVVLDPFVGSGTTCIIAQLLDRHYLGIEKEAEYIRIARHRLRAHKEKKERSGLRQVAG